MTTNLKNHMTTMEDYLPVWVDSFIADRKAQKLSNHTIRFYTNNFLIMNQYFESQSIKLISQITPDVIRQFLVHLEKVRGLNNGGVAVYYRTLRAFLNWYWEELDLEIRNPITRVKMPKQEVTEFEAVTKEQFDLLLDACGDRLSFLPARDAAILILLLSTGIRASELCNIKLKDIDLNQSTVFIEKGKGNKSRTVPFGKKTRRAIRRYQKHKRSETWLFCNQSGEKMTYNALRQILRRLCSSCNIKEVSLHSFRRAFALSCLRKGMAEITIARLMGHTSTVLIGRYAKQNAQDLIDAYISPFDDDE